MSTPSDICPECGSCESENETHSAWCPHEWQVKAEVAEGALRRIVQYADQELATDTISNGDMRHVRKIAAEALKI